VTLRSRPLRSGPAKLTEDEDSWLSWVTDYATRVARPPWRRYHTLYSKGSDAGFPDLVLARPPRLIVAELKTEAGRVTLAQQGWLDDFATVGSDLAAMLASRGVHVARPAVETYVWRPSDRAEVERILS
jgi:hypothetical protein